MKKKKPLRKEDVYPIIARYFNSGLRPHEFYRKEGLSDNQFSYWKKRYMIDHQMKEETDAPVQFHPITVSQTKPNNMSEHSGQCTHIELEYPNGVILRIDSKSDDLRIASLIKLY